MNDLTEVPRLAFPLRGVWTALNSPASQVPSHGTDYFAQTYAIDFFQMEPGENAPYRASLWRHLLLWLDASEFLCWDQPVHAAEAGRVVYAADGWFDRRRVNLPYQIARVTFASPGPEEGDNRPLAGNHVIVEGAAGYTLYAHLRNGSVTVIEGDRVAAGHPVGRVGTSGNSTMPHLHFQLMDGPDPLQATGLPFTFGGLEVLRDGAWRPLGTGMPSEEEFVRA